MWDSIKSTELCSQRKVFRYMVSISLVFPLWNHWLASPQRSNVFKTKIYKKNREFLVQGNMIVPKLLIPNGLRLRSFRLVNNKNGSRFLGTKCIILHRFHPMISCSDMKKKMENWWGRKIQRKFMQEITRIWQGQGNMKYQETSGTLGEV